MRSTPIFLSKRLDARATEQHYRTNHQNHHQRHHHYHHHHHHHDHHHHRHNHDHRDHHQHHHIIIKPPTSQHALLYASRGGSRAGPAPLYTPRVNQQAGIATFLSHTCNREVLKKKHRWRETKQSSAERCVHQLILHPASVRSLTWEMYWSWG